MLHIEAIDYEDDCLPNAVHILMAELLIVQTIYIIEMLISLAYAYSRTSGIFNFDQDYNFEYDSRNCGD